MAQNGIEKTLGIKPLDEIIEDMDLDNDESIEAEVPTKSSSDLMSRDEIVNDSFAKDMDEVYKKAMSVADSATDLGNTIDPSKAPRMFEVAGQHLKIAIDASHSKRDSQLRLMKLIQEQKKLELEELKLKSELGDDSVLKGEMVVMEERNKLLSQIKAMKENKDID